MRYIYALCEPATKSIRYIGVAVNPQRRLREHLTDNARTHKACWIRSLLRQNLKPELIILEQCNDRDWESRERFWISYYKSTGISLTNDTEGGEGGKSISKESRRKIGINTTKCLTGKPSHNLGNKYSEESIKRLSDSHKGNRNALGMHHSEETKRRLSVRFTGILNPRYGKSHTEESKNKMREHRKGKGTGKRPARSAKWKSRLSVSRIIGIEIRKALNRLLGS